MTMTDTPPLELRIFHYDLAREQSFRRPFYERLVVQLADSGYTHLMLYLEHRFRFPSLDPWAPADVMSPEDGQWLVTFASTYGIEIIPQVNCLGHTEGFMPNEKLAELREGNHDQFCPSHPRTLPTVLDMVDDLLAIFPCRYVHVGGDEVEFGPCSRCGNLDPAILYRDHYRKVCDHVLKAGRVPCIWGDMLLMYRGSDETLPRETVVFDWHYRGNSPDTVGYLQGLGFPVVVTPAIGTFWSNMYTTRDTPLNLETFTEEGRRKGVLGGCVCVWELFKGSFHDYCWRWVRMGGKVMAGTFTGMKDLLNEHKQDPYIGEYILQAEELLADVFERIPIPHFQGSRFRLGLTDVDDPVASLHLPYHKVAPRLGIMKRTHEQVSGLLERAPKGPPRRVLLFMNTLLDYSMTIIELTDETGGPLFEYGTKGSRDPGILSRMVKAGDIMTRLSEIQEVLVDSIGASRMDLNRYQKLAERWYALAIRLKEQQSTGNGLTGGNGLE